MNKAQFPEFIHEKIDPGARGPNHLRQHPLRYVGKNLLRLALLAIASEQQQSACQPLFAGVEKLIDQILLDSNVPAKHVGDETVRESMFLMQQAHHLFFFNE